MNLSGSCFTFYISWPTAVRWAEGINAAPNILACATLRSFRARSAAQSRIVLKGLFSRQRNQGAFDDATDRRHDQYWWQQSMRRTTWRGRMVVGRHSVLGLWSG